MERVADPCSLRKKEKKGVRFVWKKARREEMNLQSETSKLTMSPSSEEEKKRKPSVKGRDEAKKE